MRRIPRTKEEFAKFVDKSTEHHWIWNGHLRDSSSVPCFGNTKAAVVAWEIYNGRKVKEGHIIHHRCNELRCCKPSHLEEITRYELIKRNFRKYMRRTGFTAPNQIPLEKREAIRLNEEGLTAKELAKKYRVALETVYNIRKGK